MNRTQSYFENIIQSDFLDLNPEQQTAVEQITAAIGSSNKPYLLEGITGSGKTEVYLHVIDQTLKLGKTAIVLVPEISLTPQMTSRFISRFGSQVAIMHSGLSDGEKFDEWRKMKSNQAKVVVGARSAIFSPLKILVLSLLMKSTRQLINKSLVHAIMRGRWHYCVPNIIRQF